ncbi:MAG TPA: T9SS type A sorting domain-containing protein, partial [Candidatus Cloacimonadota bacterium]|nr:T9SS type A sorting domain-containing protein [Candidatus Cloacimonadota bacterium]
PFLAAQEYWFQELHPFSSDVYSYIQYDITVCADGNYAVNGAYWSHTLNPNLHSYECGFVYKTDVDGNIVWAVTDSLPISTYGGSVRSIHLASTDDGGLLEIISEMYDSQRYWLAKRAQDGKILWFRQLENFKPYEMISSRNDHILLAGRTVKDTIPAIQLYDQNGDEIWSHSYKHHSMIHGFLIDCELQPDGCIGAVGYAYPNASSNDRNVFCLKTAPSGDSLWLRVFDESQVENLSSIEIFQICSGISGGLVLGGDYGDTILSHGLLIWYDSQGNQQYITSSPYYGMITDLQVDHSTNELVLYSVSYLCRVSLQSQAVTWFSRNLMPMHYYCYETGATFGLLPDGYLFAGVIRYVSGEDGINFLVRTNAHGNYVSDNEQMQPIMATMLNYPNPFLTATTIEYELEKNGLTEICIYNLKGQKVMNFSPSRLTSGHYTINWNGKDLHGNDVPSGVYFASCLMDGKCIGVRKMVRIK